MSLADYSQRRALSVAAFHLGKDIKEAVNDAEEQKGQQLQSAKVLCAEEQQIEAVKTFVAALRDVQR